jgi:hypothetical protein
LVGYSKAPHALALLQDADGRQWTEPSHLLCSFRATDEDAPVPATSNKHQAAASSELPSAKRARKC